MELNVTERLLTIGLLPEKGSFTNLKLIREARERLSFTDEEHKALCFKDGDGNLSWQSEHDKPKEIELGEVVTGLIKESLKSLDEKEELSADHFDLYIKFMGK